MKSTTFKLIGLLCVALGLIGAFLPIMPTTIFFILAAAAFARSSPELEKRILDDPRIGPSVRLWRDHGVVPMRAKFFALGGMALGYVVFLLTAKPHLWLALLVGALIGACAWYVGSRPSEIED